MHIGVDIGGTNLVAGLVDETGKILAKAKTPTLAERGLQPILDDILKICGACVQKAGLSRDAVESIGIGSPGMVDRERGLLLYSNNLPFDNTPMAALVSKVWAKPVFVENDANCAALGELYAGAARGVKNAVVVTLGTGIGGGVVLDGKLFSGTAGAGAEIGHMVIQVNGQACSCGRKGCWEAYASATGLCRATARAMAENPQSALWTLCHGDNREVTAQTAFAAAKMGDETGKALVDWYIDHLSAGLINIVNIFRPERICLGGGISNEDDEYLLDPLRRRMEQEVYAFARCPVELVKAELGNDAGIIGAAYLYRQ